MAKPTTVKREKKTKSAKPTTEANAEFRARVRMYRQGLGDCFLITFPRKAKPPFQMLIDCGVLVGDSVKMTELVEHIRDTVQIDKNKPAQLDVVVGTHEHKDHLSGFNQARKVFDDDFKFGEVWLPWTENLTQPEIAGIKKARRTAVKSLRKAVKRLAGVTDVGNMCALAAFSDDTAEAGDVPAVDNFDPDIDAKDEINASTRSIAGALGYLKKRGKQAGVGKLRYCEPGEGPLELEGVEGVRVYVLGPPRDPILLKGSEVTEQMKQDGVVFHLSAGSSGAEALTAALPKETVTASKSPAGVAAAAAANADATSNQSDAAPSDDVDRFHPFGAEHRIGPEVGDPNKNWSPKPNPVYDTLKPFIEKHYLNPEHAWRNIDDDWTSAFGQLALDLDSDTNNTSVVLAFEFMQTQEVLLFVGDAQVGNWRSWANVQFKMPDRDTPMTAHDLLRRTVFYKVGHHCSHNATLDKGGLRLMTRDDLVAFVPLDKATAKKMGKIDPLNGEPKGWDMPAKSLLKALTERTQGRVFLSDRSENPKPIDTDSYAVTATENYIEYLLK